MEDLTKQQIILLALLVSFVSSIATGIVTISLVQQDEPATETQTINRIVERTIQSVSDTPASASVAKNTETIVVREDQAVVNAISKANKGIVRIYVSYGGAKPSFTGLGVIVSSSGKIVAKISSASDGIFTAQLDGGNTVSVSRKSFDAVTGLSVLQDDQNSNPQSARVYSGAILGDSQKISVGQTSVLIAGDVSPIVATGIISSVEREGGPYPATNPVKTIQSSVKDATFISGAILINLSGEILGIKDQSQNSSFVPSGIIKGL